MVLLALLPPLAKLHVTPTSPRAEKARSIRRYLSVPHFTLGIPYLCCEVDSLCSKRSISSIVLESVQPAHQKFAPRCDRFIHLPVALAPTVGWPWTICKSASRGIDCGRSLSGWSVHHLSRRAASNPAQANTHTSSCAILLT